MLGKKLRQKEGMLGEMTLDQLVLVQLALELAFELLLSLGLKLDLLGHKLMVYALQILRFHVQSHIQFTKTSQ